MNTFIIAGLAGTLAIVLETIYRRADGFPLWAIIPGALLTYLVYRNIHGAPTLLVGAAAFSCATLLSRMVVSSAVLHEPVIRGNLAAAVLMLLAVTVGYTWR